MKIYKFLILIQNCYTNYGYSQLYNHCIMDKLLKFEHVKRIWITLFFLYLCPPVQAQAPWPTWMYDGLSHGKVGLIGLPLFPNCYKKINTSNLNIGIETAANLANVEVLTSVIDAQHEELFSINPFLRKEYWEIKKFILGPAFSYNWGYNSYGYIKKKYPIINPNPKTVFKNTVIRARFFRKLEDEASKIDNYLNTRYPIPEGERILLILNALENVINITIKHEKY